MTPLVEMLTRVLTTGAENIGLPMRAVCLFSDKAVVIIDADTSLKLHFTGVLDGHELPVLVTMAGPDGMKSDRLAPPQNPNPDEPVN